MKAIILELKDGYAAALREDGVVVKTRRLGEVGSTVELDEKTVAFPARRKRIARTAVAAALALAVTGGTYTYTNVAAAYVTLDTEESSVELSVNRLGRVIGVRAVDDDSAALAQSLSADLRSMKVEDAMDAVMTRLYSEGYLEAGDAQTLVAGVTCQSERNSASLQDAVARGVGRNERGDVELVTLEVSPRERREAGEREMSGGRYVFEREGGFGRGGDSAEVDYSSEWYTTEVGDPGGSGAATAPRPQPPRQGARDGDHGPMPGGLPRQGTDPGGGDG